MYGLARQNPIIVAPNATGLLLGVAQGVLCMLYPAKQGGAAVNGVATSSSIAAMTPQPVAQAEDDFD